MYQLQKIFPQGSMVYSVRPNISSHLIEIKMLPVTEAGRRYVTVGQMSRRFRALDGKTYLIPEGALRNCTHRLFANKEDADDYATRLRFCWNIRKDYRIWLLDGCPTEKLEEAAKILKVDE